MPCKCAGTNAGLNATMTPGEGIKGTTTSPAWTKGTGLRLLTQKAKTESRSLANYLGLLASRDMLLSASQQVSGSLDDIKAKRLSALDKLAGLWAEHPVESPEDYVRSLRGGQRMVYEPPPAQPQTELLKAMRHAVGIWKNRKDMKSSTGYVRKLRKGTRLKRLGLS